MRKAVAYLRRSTDKQAASIDRQRAAIEEWAEAEGVTILAWHEEAPTCREKSPLERPAMMAALDDVAEHGADLVADESSRLGAGMDMLGFLRYTVADSGGNVVTVDGSSTGDPMLDQIMALLKAWADQAELVKLRRRTRLGLARRRSKGHAIGPEPAYGWKREGDRVVECPREQAIRRLILHMRGRGDGYKKIIGELKRRGMRPRGKAWYPTTVRRIVNQERLPVATGG